MRLGFSSMNTPEEHPPDVLARVLEDRGYDSLWVGEHTHIPISRRTPYPAGGELPGPYLRMMDPFLALMLAAGATTSLLVGTGVSLPLEHDVLALAKTAATLDRLSGGRLLFGVGVGWNREELANHSNIPWGQRYQALEEYVGALRCLWTEEKSEFHGRYIGFDPVWSLPKPIGRPLPVYCGMGGKLGTQHAVRWADAWMPMDVALGTIAKGQIERKVRLFREAAAGAGRGHLPITMVAFGDPTPETLHHYAGLGVERTVVGVSRETAATPPRRCRFSNATPSSSKSWLPSTLERNQPLAGSAGDLGGEPVKRGSPLPGVAPNPFGEVGLLRHFPEESQGALPALLSGALPVIEHLLLDGRHRPGRAVQRHVLCVRECLSEQLFRRTDPVDEADGIGLFGEQHPRRQEQVHGSAGPDHSGEQP